MTKSGLTHIWRNLLRRIRWREYTHTRDAIVRHFGFVRHDAIKFADIQECLRYPEMVFDVIVIRLKNGTEVRWLDRDGTLINALEEAGFSCRQWEG